MRGALVSSAFLLLLACRSQTLDLRSEQRLETSSPPGDMVVPGSKQPERDSGMAPVMMSVAPEPQPASDAGDDVPMGFPDTEFDASALPCNPFGRCSEGLVCDQQTWSCRECRTNYDCTPEVCDLETRRCRPCQQARECGVNWLCGESSKWCLLSCMYNADCGGGYCNRELEQDADVCLPCGGGDPQSEQNCRWCERDTDCPRGFGCFDRRCEDLSLPPPDLDGPPTPDPYVPPASSTSSPEPEPSSEGQGGNSSSNPSGAVDASVPVGLPGSN